LLKIRDISFYLEFFDDLSSIPANIQAKLENRINAMSDMIQYQGWSELLNSFNAHKISGTEIWIGHITNGGKAYRILFEVDSRDVMWIWHFFSHKENDLFIKNLAYKIPLDKNIDIDYN